MPYCDGVICAITVIGGKNIDSTHVHLVYIYTYKFHTEIVFRYHECKRSHALYLRYWTFAGISS